MVQDNDKEPSRPASARKVARPAPGDASAAVDPAPATAAPRPRRSTPFWRKGRFWVAVIAIELVVALGLSFALERSSTQVDLAGGDLAAFCAQIQALREQGPASGGDSTQGGSIGDPARFEQERDAYLALVAVAPPDLVPDLERLAELDDQIIVTVREIGARKAEDPSYSGAATLAAALDGASAEGRVAAARVNLALLEGCGIAGPAGPTGTTRAPTVAVPGSAPS